MATFPRMENPTAEETLMLDLLAEIDEYLSYDFKGDSNGLFVIPGFTVKYNSAELPVGDQLSENEIRAKLQALTCFRGIPKGTVKYEVSIMTQLIQIYRKHVREEQLIDSIKPRALATMILREIGLTKSAVDGKIVVNDNLFVGDNNERLWPLETLFLTPSTTGVKKTDYQTKVYKELDFEALVTKLVSAVGSLRNPYSRLTRVIEAFGANSGRDPRKRARITDDQPFVYDLFQDDPRVSRQDVNDWKSKAWDKIEDYNEQRQFQKDFLYGDVSMAMERLDNAKPEANEEAELYASKWATALNTMNKDRDELLAANQLDADRKICLEFLYRLYDCCCSNGSKVPNPERVESVIRKFDRDRRIVGMLYLLLVFDRAKSVHFNKDKKTGICGMHWYGEKDLPEWEHTNPSKHTINKRLVWFTYNYLGITSQECEDGWLFELLQPRKRETD